MTTDGRQSAALPGSFLASLTDPERADLERLAVTRTFPPGAVMMFEHEPGERVMIIIRGRVKVSGVRDDGRELMFSIRDPGDVLGELSFVDEDARVATVSALEAVEAIVIPSRAFRAHLEATPRLALILLETVSARFRQSTQMRSQFAASDTMGRVAARIMELADRYGLPQDDGVAIAMPISQEELASWAGASRAGAAQALQSMRELGWLLTDRRWMLVTRPDALRARAA